MVNFFAAGGLLFALEHSTPAGRFVIGTLLIASLVSWSVIASKQSEVSLAKKQTARFLAKFRASRKPLQVFLSRETFHGSPVYEVYRAGCRELCYHLTGSSEIDEMTIQRLAAAPPLSQTAFSAVESALGREVGIRGLQLDARMIFLATAVSGGPFLGLLGTVWGVMDTFSDIAEAGKASLAAMAPGVSGALITTVTGLLVAIPAMFGYNYLVSTIRTLTVEMDNFAAELASAFGHRYAAGAARTAAERD